MPSKLSDLSPHPRNPRLISDDKLKMLKKSLEIFGDLSGFVYNVKTKRLISGHQRQKVLPSTARIIIEKKYPKPTKQGTVAIGYVEIDGERHKYRETSWDETTEKAANIAANQHGGDWDLKILPEFILELDEANWPLDSLGFNEKEMADIMAPIGGLPGGKTDDDAVPTPPKKAVSKLGDLFILGNHRLLCGDSTDAKQVERLIGHRDKLEMTFTSPPYNLGISAKLSGNYVIGKRGNVYEAYNDNKDQGEWLSLIVKATENSLAFSRYVFVNIQPLAGNRNEIWSYSEIFSKRYCDLFVWDKGHAPPQQAERVLNSRFELIWIFTSDEKPSRAIRIAPEFRGTIDNVYEGSPQRKNESSEVHGATFPVHLPEYFISNFTKPNDSVFEPFCGSGTTLIACEKTQRRAYCVEIDPIYIDVILDRWADYTGKDPVREDGVKWSVLKNKTQV